MQFRKAWLRAGLQTTPAPPNNLGHDFVLDCSSKLYLLAGTSRKDSSGLIEESLIAPSDLITVCRVDIWAGFDLVAWSKTKRGKMKSCIFFVFLAVVMCLKSSDGRYKKAGMDELRVLESDLRSENAANPTIFESTIDFLSWNITSLNQSKQRGKIFSLSFWHTG